MTAITEPKQEEVLFFPLKPPYVTRPSWLLIQPCSRDQSLWVQLGLSRLFALDSSQDASSQREKVKEELVNIWRESRWSGGFKTHHLIELCRITRSQIRGLQLVLVGTYTCWGLSSALHGKSSVWPPGGRQVRACTAARIMTLLWGQPDEEDVTWHEKTLERCLSVVTSSQQ